MKVVLAGKVMKIGETQEFGANKTKKRVVRMDISTGGIASVVEINLMHDNAEKADQIKVGEQIEATGSLMGRLYTGADNVEKCFMEIQVYKIAKIGRVVL